ncbi:hypothetical protein D3C85_1920580 [compost metagenome]
MLSLPGVKIYTPAGAVCPPSTAFNAASVRTPMGVASTTGVTVEVTATPLRLVNGAMNRNRDPF